MDEERDAAEAGSDEEPSAEGREAAGEVASELSDREEEIEQGDAEEADE